jgi:hypothetical protein
VTLSFRRSSYLACRDGLEPAGQPRAASRDHIILWSKDLGRSLDDLQSRADIDNTNIAYLSFSLGGAIARRTPVCAHATGMTADYLMAMVFARC